MKLIQYRALCIASLFGLALSGTACTSSDPADDGAGGTGAGGTGGGGGTGNASAACESPIVLQVDLITDFEDNDGSLPLFTGNDTDPSYTYLVGGSDAMPDAITGGFFALDDATGSYSFDFIDGAEGSTWAISAQNTMAEDWGGGLGLWHSCMDASAFTGMSVWIKGTSGRDNIVRFGLVGADGVTEYVNELTMPADWELMEIPFSSFATEASGVVFSAPHVISKIFFAAGVAYPTGAPEPAPYEISIDNIGLY